MKCLDSLEPSLCPGEEHGDAKGLWGQNGVAASLSQPCQGDEGEELLGGGQRLSGSEMVPGPCRVRLLRLQTSCLE